MQHRCNPMRQLHDFRRRGADRRGAASLDYILLLGILLPLIAFVVPQSMRIVRGVYEMILVLIAWPFL